MNERIKEFAEQARLSYVMTPDKPYIMEDLEKFAELIVKECAGICDLYGMPDGTSTTAMILSLSIKQHFGVEE